MQGQYEVNSDSKYTPFFIPGDSGSAVFIRETTGSLTCVGIALGKTSYGTAIVTPIGAVLDELHLQDSDVTKFP
ncbi:hypothetical protein FSP39_004268 [Pinctada imbricata]|uniref:Uncharacterized protein n=1 Tax=Pinctada imbricata TaxID=66713 RepID=A0AA88YWK4_PINIB|nr:hypothetical protein FSP39_004268 [Pinctada imbricata]